ncbi:PEP-CTERM sorting domain-containing protein [Aquabacterium sp.]|uniref:PEP-CTERM sorting domain-containing protein n=1 Tax=Aquabacterium sp. TaxID=1872578 RepID=UPI0035B11924
MKRTMSFVLMAVLLSSSAFAAGKSDNGHGNAGQGNNAGGNGHGQQVSFQHISDQGLSHAGPYSAPIRSTVPEPETYALAMAGLGVVGIAAWRRRRAR